MRKGDEMETTASLEIRQSVTNNRPACRAGLHNGCPMKNTVVFVGFLPSYKGRENIGNWALFTCS